MTTQKQTHILFLYCCVWVSSSIYLYSQNSIPPPVHTAHEVQDSNVQISNFRLFNVESNKFIDETASLLSTHSVTLNKKNPLGLLKLKTINNNLKNKIRYAWRIDGQTEWMYQTANEFDLVWKPDNPHVNFIVKGREADGSWANHEIRITIENSPKPSTSNFWLSTVILFLMGVAIVAVKYSFSKMGKKPSHKVRQTKDPRLNIVIAEPEMVIAEPENTFLTVLNTEIIAHMSDSDFNVDSLSSKLGMTVKHLRKQVNDATSMSLTHYIQDVRLEHAMTLLTQHQVDSIKHLSEVIGMRDQKYFSKAFKLKFGKPPSEFLRNIDVKTDS